MTHMNTDTYKYSQNTNFNYMDSTHITCSKEKDKHLHVIKGLFTQSVKWTEKDKKVIAGRFNIQEDREVSPT